MSDALSGRDDKKTRSVAGAGYSRAGGHFFDVKHSLGGVMPIASDIVDQVRADFPAEDVPRVLGRLETLSEGERILRCIVFAARGHIWYFDLLCRLSKVDYRDVIMAAEYERLGDRLYDFSQPIPEARIAIDRHPSPNVLRK